MATASIPARWTGVRVCLKPSKLSCFRSSASYRTRPRSGSATTVRYRCRFAMAFSFTPRARTTARPRRVRPRVAARVLIPQAPS